MLLSFYHTCASKQHRDLHDSLLCCHFHILVGIFHYRTWLVYSNDGLPQMPEVFMSKQVGCTPTQFLFELSYTYSSSASVAWQSLLLALTSIDGHLHSLLISLVDVRLSPFLSSHITPTIIPYSTIVLYPWLALMYCIRIEGALKAEAGSRDSAMCMADRLIKRVL